MHQLHGRINRGGPSAPAVFDLAPSGLWCPAPTPTQGYVALRPGLNYLRPYGLQSAHARREVANVEMVSPYEPAPLGGLPHTTGSAGGTNSSPAACLAGSY